MKLWMEIFKPKIRISVFCPLGDDDPDAYGQDVTL